MITLCAKCYELVKVTTRGDNQGRQGGVTRRGDKRHNFKIFSNPLPPLALRQGDDAGTEGKKGVPSAGRPPYPYHAPPYALFEPTRRAFESGDNFLKE